MEATVIEELVATIWFIDGVWRPVHESADGRQYGIDGDSEKVYGVWSIQPDEPTPTIVIDATAYR